MALTLTYRIQGDKETIERLRRVGGRLANLSGVMHDIGQYLTDFFAGPVFASHGSIIGHPWPRLSEPYAEWKAEHYPGRPPLVREGDMINAFKSRSGSTWAIVENTDPKFAWHQLGTGGKGEATTTRMAVARTMLGLGGVGYIGRGNNLPARTMMDIDHQREQHIRDLINDEVKRILETA